MKTQEELNALATKDLLAYYNSLTGEKVKRFSTRTAGIRRVLKAQKEAEQFGNTVFADVLPAGKSKAKKEARKPSSKPSKKAARKVANSDSGSSRRGPNFNFPVKDEIKGHRQGTKRAAVIALLKAGPATIEEIQAETGWDRRTAIEGTVLLHKYVGYGMRQDDEGRIHLLES